MRALNTPTRQNFTKTAVLHNVNLIVVYECLVIVAYLKILSKLRKWTLNHPPLLLSTSSYLSLLSSSIFPISPFSTLISQILFLIFFPNVYSVIFSLILFTSHPSVLSFPPSFVIASFHAFLMKLYGEFSVIISSNSRINWVDKHFKIFIPFSIN